MVRATASVTGRSPLRAFWTFLWESCVGEAATKSWLEKFPSVRRRSRGVWDIARKGSYRRRLQQRMIPSSGVWWRTRNRLATWEMHLSRRSKASQRTFRERMLNMSKVLIIGAGGVANVVAKKCAQNSADYSELLIATRTKSRADKIASSITNIPVHTAQVDADHASEVAAIIRDYKPALVMNIALPYQDLAIMDACLETGVDYLDTANYEPKDVAKFEYSWQWAYQERFQKAGLMALLGTG